MGIPERIVTVRRLRPGLPEERRRRWGRVLMEILDALGVEPGDEFVVAHPAALPTEAADA